MELSELSKVSTWHHAYAVIGDALGSPEKVLALLESRGIKTVGNPDVLIQRYQDMSVDVVRDTLQTYASLKPLSGAKYAVISFSAANQNAQNALLKIIEEAPGGTHFFFCVDSIGHLLPTVRSRCIAVSVSRESRKKSEGGEEAIDFFKATYAERLATVEKMSSYISKTQDRGPVRAFIRSLLEAAHAGSVPPQPLRDILDAEGYLRLSGSSPKSILGHLAVSLPRR